MWQTNINGYRARIAQNLSEQTNIQFLYILLQESIRYLELKQKEFIRNLSWFHDDRQYVKDFIKRSQVLIKNFESLKKDTSKFQLSILRVSLSSVHLLLKENYMNDDLLLFLSSCEEVNRYSDFSGGASYDIPSPIVKLCFDLSTEFYQKNSARLYKMADELAMVPRIKNILGLNRMPGPVKESNFYKIGQRNKIDALWLDAAFPKRLCAHDSKLYSHLNENKEKISTYFSLARYFNINKQVSSFARDVQKSLSALCRLDENALLSDVERAAKNIERFTLTKKTGRRSIIALVNDFIFLHKYDGHYFSALRSGNDFKIISESIYIIKLQVKQRIGYLRSLDVMSQNLSILKKLEKSFNNLIDYIRRHVDFYLLAYQFVEREKFLPTLTIEIEMQRSDEYSELKKLRLVLFDIADSYGINFIPDNLEGLLYSLDSINKIREHSQANLPLGCMIDPDKMMGASDLSILTYFIFARRYADYQNNIDQNMFIPLAFDKKVGLILHPDLQHTRFVDLLETLQVLKSTPLLHYSVRLVAVAMMQASRTSEEYLILHKLLTAILTNRYSQFVSNHHASLNDRHWVMEYLPYAIESFPSELNAQLLPARLLGNGCVTESAIFPQPKYSLDENISVKYSMDVNKTLGGLEIHRVPLLYSSLRNSLIVLSNSPGRRKSNVDSLEDVFNQSLNFARNIINEYEDYSVIEDCQKENLDDYDNIRKLYQKTERNGHDKVLVIIYILVTWYYTQREDKLGTEARFAYEPMIEACILLGKALSSQLRRPKPIDYKIFEVLIHLNTKRLAGSAKELHSTLLKLIPYAHLGLELGEDDFKLIDIAKEFVHQFPSVFYANQEGVINDAIIQALIEYRGVNKFLLLRITLWQAALRYMPESMINSPENFIFIKQADHWLRRARIAIEGDEQSYSIDITTYLPTESQLDMVSVSIKNIWIAIQALSPESSKTDIVICNDDHSFIALSSEHLNSLSMEEAQKEFMRYLIFIFASQLTLTQEYLDQLTHRWESQGPLAASVKIIIMLLECYELHYSGDHDAGIDMVCALKKRFEHQQYALTSDDMPESLQNRSRSVGYSKLRMVLFSISGLATSNKSCFEISIKK